MAICGNITENKYAAVCTDPSVIGVEEVYYIFNKSDISGYVRDVTNPQIITGITMKASKKGFRYEGAGDSTKPRWEMVRGTYTQTYDHIVAGIIFERGSAAKKELEGLANGRYVVVVENLHKNGDAAFEIFGTDIGLVARTMTGDATNADTSGAYPFELGSPEAYKEPHTPATFFSTDLAGTRTALEAIITPVEPEV